MRHALIFVLFAFFNTVTSGQSLSGEPLLPPNGKALLKHCEGWEKLNDPATRERLATRGDQESADAMMGSLVCLGYLRGFLSGYQYATVGGSASSSPLAFCLPATADGLGNPIRALLTFLRNNPGFLDLSTSVVIGLAFKNAYPCSTSKSGDASAPKSRSSLPLRISGARLLQIGEALGLESAGAMIRQSPIFSAHVANDLPEDVIEGDFRIMVFARSGDLLRSYAAKGRATVKVGGHAGTALVPSRATAEVRLLTEATENGLRSGQPPDPNDSDGRRNRVVLASDPSKLKVDVYPTRLLLGNGRELICSPNSCTEKSR